MLHLRRDAQGGVAAQAGVNAVTPLLRAGLSWTLGSHYTRYLRGRSSAGTLHPGAEIRRLFLMR
jgi:hypothetical protein